MKKIFTHLFAVLLLSLVATSNVWAQETTEISLNFSEGTCNSTSGVYCSSWSSTTNPVVTISVVGGNNNLVVNPSSDNFEMHEGSNGSTWTFSVTGYRIVSYSFTYKTKQTGNDVTITIGETTYTSSDSEQPLEIAGLDSPTASFSLSGNNKGVVVSNLKLNVYKHSSLTALEEGQVYMFKNARADRSLRADGAGDVHTKATDANDTAQQWYVTKENGYYILRNVAYGKYLNGASSSGTAWSLTDDYSATENKFELHTSNYETLNTLKTNGSNEYGYMHDDNNANNGCYNVVGWLNGNTNTGSHWTITKVDYTAEQITALLEKAPTVAEIAGYTTALGELFTDVACVTPKLGSLAEAQASDAYKALPTGLKAMVDKVYNEKTEYVALETAWAEDNANDEKSGWSGKYAKKFRVQMYEPYSIAGDITSWLGINAHANNDNPTGIYVPEAGTLYIMVEGTINDGASLRIVDGGHNNRVTNATGGGYALKPGLNVINYTGTAGMLYICYNVDTYNPDGTDDDTRFPHKLSEYAPLKIHIEGGAINGYYNACGDFRATAQDGSDNLWKTISGANVDCDADWEYMETRANLSVLPLLAHRQILLFQLEDLNSDMGMKTLLPDLLEFPEKPYNYTEEWNSYEGMGLNTSTGRINIMLEAWDRIMYSELATMGLVSQSTMAQMNAFYPRWERDYTTKYEMYDYENESEIDGKTYLEFCGVDYSDVFNHHGVALGTESGYMYGGWDHCGYHINTFGGIVQNMANNAGSTWGPAHEIGHQHQALLTLNGLTEVTNNLFSNIALWYKGMSTSRYNGSNGSLESVLNAYNTEGSDIYTNNIWALTHLYYRLWLYYHLAGNNTQFYPRLFELLRHEPMQKGYNVSGDVSTLHFYKLACQAAGEDLTEFFRAHGYFSIMDDRLVGDYANSVYEVSQKMIDDAIAEVKAMTDANGDPLKENLAIIFICDDDENATYVQHDGVTERDIYDETTSNSDFGSVSDFINGNVSVETTYTATLNSDGTLTMSGGEGGVGFLVLNEDGEIVSFSNKSTFALSDEAAYLLATGKASVVTVDTESTTTEAEVDVTAMRFALLQELIEKATALTQNTSETRVGFYKTSAVTNLQAYITMAQEVITNGDLANLQAVYELLYAEYNAVVANEFSRVVLVPGSKFAIISVKSNDRILTYSGSNVTTVSGDADDYSSTVAYQWYIERDGAYYIKNAGTSKYIQDVTDQNGVLYTVGDNKVNMNINEVALGCYTIATSNVPGRYMNMDGADSERKRIITWGDAYSENSQWAFILLEADDTNAAKEELLELSKKTLALVNEVATVSYNEESKIELQTNSGNANYIWSNAAVSGNDVDKLLDSDKNTYFHSQWNNSTAPTDGWGHHLTVDLGEDPSLTSFKFKFTTRNEGNLSNYPKTIEVYGSNVGGNDVANYTKLQVASGFATGAGVDNEAVVMGNGTAYRYLRFLVTDATGNNAGTNTGSDGMVFFHMSEFSIYPVMVSATVKSDYTPDVTVGAVLAAYNDAEQGKTVYNNASATIDDINAKKTALGDGADVAGSYTTLLNLYNSVLNSVLAAKKTQLETLITNTENLIKTVGGVEFNDENQPVVTMTNTSTKADEALVLDTYLATAKSKKLSDAATTVALLDAAIADQQAAYDELDKAIKTPAVLDKSGLEELVALAQPLYDKMATNGVVNVDYAPSALTNAQLTAASDALAAANEALASATSQAALDEAKATLQTAYDALLTVENANEKNTITTTDLSTLIGSVEELLERVATTGTSKGEIALQAGDANSEFYIWSNAPAYDCNGYSNKVEGLIDVNEDGSANTGTFFGTDWESAVAAYTHYLEVDLGVATSINKLSMDYTTRASGYANQRPTAIKILGSNNKVDYTEVTTIEEGLATGACEQWAMDTPLELGARYRYIRFAVATQDTTGYFNMSDFNLYSISDKQFSDYYSTADADLNALLLALEVAKDALSRHYLTSVQYTAIKEKLNSVYNDVNNVIALDYTTRDDLTKLIDDTEDLIEKVATVTEVVTPVLSTTNLYCNADNTTNASANDSDKLGVAALLDGKVSTHLHTTYGGNAQDDDLDHYIRVDMGDGNAVAAFEFSYTGRSDNSGNDPTTIIIQGCNTVGGEWVDIKTLTNLPTDGDKVQYSSGLIEASEAYRYIRFMVTETENNSYTTYNGIQHKFFVMSEFSFTAYPTVEVAEGFINVTTALVRAAYDEKNTATAENGHYMTESDYNAALAALQADYDALSAASKTNKTALEELIEATSLLKNSLYEMAITSYTASKVPLSITEGEAGYIYCNAPEKNSTWETDNAGVAALIDLTDGDEPNLETFLHTEYGNDQSADGLDHYLRVDLGVDGATDYIEFGYFGRGDGNGAHLSKSPKKVIVAATNDLTDGGEWTTIDTLYPAEASATVETKTGAVGNGVAYRYWRFLVEETYEGSEDGNNHQYFCMSQFNVYECTDVVISSQLKSEYNPNIHIYTATELVDEVEAALVTANGVVDDAEVLQPAVDAAVVALQLVYDKLAHAVEYYWCPVKLTTDVSNPALYTIDAIGRGNSKAWQYNAQNNNITVVEKDASNLYHLWYFVQGDEEYTVKIVPVMTPGYELTANSADFSNGADKVSAAAENGVSWLFYKNSEYNFKPYGKNTYLSNFGAGSNALGFYATTDGGSSVRFTAVEVEDYAKARLAKLAEGKSAVTAGTTVGTYSENSANEYNTALDAANNMAETSTPQDYIDAFTRLFNASNGLVINMPQSDKFYVLRCNYENRYIYVNAENKLQWAASSYDKALSNAVWVFEDVDASAATYKMKSLHTQSYLSGLSGSQWAFGEEGKVVTLAKSPSVDGAVIFKIEGNGNNGLQAHGENNTVISYTNDAGANHYFFEEVDDVTTIKHTVTMSAVFSSVMLGYNATVPAGVEAYIATGINGGYVSLEKVAEPGETLPAGTPVILYRTDEETSKVFTYSEEMPVIVDGESVLGGSLFVMYVECDTDKDYYKLMLKDGEAKMYWMYKEFDANGESQGETDAGGHIKCSANKIYMALQKSGSNPVTMYGMRFIDDSATGVDGVKDESGEVKAIYDLQGRKLTEITEPGMYIVDGKKVYVK